MALKPFRSSGRYSALLILMMGTLAWIGHLSSVLNVSTHKVPFIDDFEVVLDWVGPTRLNN